MDSSAKGCVGLFGGSFSPPHIGHVLACHYALARWQLKKVLVIPSAQHPFGKDMPPISHRYNMCKTAFQHLGHFVEISLIEAQREGISYTIDTVRELTRQNSAEHYRLIVGGDILADTHKWREFDELTRLAPLLVIPRQHNGDVLGGDADDAVLPDVNSSRLRQALAEKKDPGTALPAAVYQYILQHNLYSPSAE